MDLQNNNMLLFNKDICQNLSQALEKEWLETNGIGGYASSTIIGANTRRYHGLLMAATRPPLGRTLMLSKVEESLCFEEQEIPLSTNIYPNARYPEGYKNLVRFCLTPFPTFDYSIDGIIIQKIVFMVHGENTTVILYRVGATRRVVSTLKIRVMIAFRDYHSLTHENPFIKSGYKQKANGICIQPYESLPPMYLYHNAQSMDNAQFWYKNMEYPKEIERGLEAHEDHFSPFALCFDLSKGTDFYVVASTLEHEKVNIKKLLNKERNRRKHRPAMRHVCNQDHSPPSPSPKASLLYSTNTAEGQGGEGGEEKKLAQLVNCLLSTSHSFIVKRETDKKSIIAGYHWFGDWGRDTMISLPGLTLVQGKFEEAREILLSYAQYVSKGMIPNRFPDYGETPEYNTVDASLWFINAIYQYLRFAKDFKIIQKNLYGVLKEIVEYYRKGTRFNIYMDTDGLVYAGTEGVQLTWMDAKAGDWVVTPRRGKAVEINALWYNGLKIMSFFAREMRLMNESAEYNTLALRVYESFNSLFWFEDGQYLYDYIDDASKNSAIRPNQIFAVSLPYSMVSLAKQRSIINIVQEHLLTPYGLRSLSPKDKDYIGRYCGNVYERDRAYHQGTVWAWLIGPYISAYARAYAGQKDTTTSVKELFKPFYTHLFEAGLGTISEIFDGDPPHTPRGCISQAWSVGEILRAYFEHVYGLQESVVDSA